MKFLLRLGFTLVVAVVVVLAGLALLAHSGPAVGTVHGTDFRGPKVTIDGAPRMERGPQFRILVGDNRKTARWVKVNAVQYAGCAEGNRWNGTLCSKFALSLPEVPTLSGRTIAGGTRRGEGRRASRSGHMQAA